MYAVLSCGNRAVKIAWFVDDTLVLDKAFVSKHGALSTCVAKLCEKFESKLREKK